jgi:hypothetical protein
MPTKRLLIPFALILGALLIGQRFGFAWAGGNGYVPEIGAYAEDGTHYRRGETVMTGVDERLYLRVGVPGSIGSNAEFWLDRNTEMTLDRTNDHVVAVRLVRGRIYAVSHMPNAPLVIRTNFTQSDVPPGFGAVSVVNYDYLETVSVIPFNTKMTVTTRESEPVGIEKPVNVHETPPISIVEFSFDPSVPDVAEFYAWSGVRN